MKAKIEQGLGVALILAVIVLFFLWRHEKGAHFDASLARDQAEARASVSSKIADAKVQKVLGDSAAAWTRRTVQQTQRADSLDNALGTVRRSLTNIGVTIDKGTGKASGAVHVVYVPVPAGSSPGTQPLETRTAHFDVKAGVFGVVADVSLPAPPDSGTMAATVTAPKIPLSLRLSCGPATDGVHRADAVVTGPRWATVGIDHTEAAPEVCNPTMKLDTGTKVPLWLMITSDVVSVYAGWKLAQKAQQITVVTK
jgi:hypothetical protein